MKCYLIMTILGADRQGLVSSVAEIVTGHGGNWLESRMARLAGQFAGIARVECPEDQVDNLTSALRQPGLNVQIVRQTIDDPADTTTVEIEVMGNDRTGIVRELTTAIAGAGGNVEELTTGLESAPMSGQPMFRATGRIALSEGISIEALRCAIENLGEDLTVDLRE